MKRYLDGFLEAQKRGGGEAPEDMPTLDQLKNEYIEYLLERTIGNKSLTARILNISRTALYDRLSESDAFIDSAWLKKTGRLSSH